MKRLMLVAAGAAALAWSARAEAETSGSVGDGSDDVKWSVVANVLTVYGSGSMTNFEWTTDRPWHAYADSITNVIVGDGVTSIGDSAFAGFGQLGEVSVSANVTRIGRNAFFECPQLAKVDLSGATELTSIGECCFYHNVSLVEVKLPASLVDVGDSAFWGCVSLKTPEFAPGSNLKRIGALAFYRCESMEEFFVGASVTNVGVRAFGWCKGLARVMFAGADTDVATNAFAGVGWDGKPLYTGTAEMLLAVNLDMASDMIVLNDATEAIPYDFACFGPAYAANLPELYLPEGWKGVRYVEPYEPWCCGFFDCKNFVIPWGTLKYPWHIGATEDDGVYAYVDNGVLCIVGSGDICQYESVEEAPWFDSIDQITQLSLQSGLESVVDWTMFEGLDPATVIAGIPGLTLGMLFGGDGGSLVPAPENIKVENGEVTLHVSVSAAPLVDASSNDWAKVSFVGASISADDDKKVILRFKTEQNSQSGFYRLLSGK